MTAPPTLGVIIVAAGSGVRFGDADKALAPLAGRPLLAWSVSLFATLPATREIVVVASPRTRDRCQELLNGSCRFPASVVLGGPTRAESVRAGIAALSAAIRHVAVHDAARPLANAELVQRVLDAAATTGAAIPVVPVSDTLHVISQDGTLASTPDRDNLRLAQTPQIARRDWLETAHLATDGTTDEGGLLHAAGFPVRLVAGDLDNLKITWPRDLALAEALLATREALR